MRLQSHIWVSALLRAELTEGEYATVLRKGSPEAGAIFVIHLHDANICTVYAPAPQSFFEEGRASERRFEVALDGVDQEDARQWLDKQIAFDPDCWIVECERRVGKPSILTGPDGRSDGV